MKTIKKIILLGILSLLMFACSKDDDNDSSSTNKLKTGQVELKGYPDPSGIIKFVAIAKTITIDWGDGTIDKLTPNGVETEFFHHYADSNFRTILIDTDNLTGIFFIDWIIDFREMRFGDCPNLKYLNFYTISLTILDIKRAKSLQSLCCIDNQLTELNLYECFSLQELFCDQNRLSSLNLSGCPALERLSCSSNQLTELTISKNFNLRLLQCHNNQLSELTISNLTALQAVNCSYNRLIEINNKGCTTVESLDCRDNQLSSGMLNTVFENLPLYKGDYETYVEYWYSAAVLRYDSGHLNISGNPGINSCNPSIAANKGWMLM